MFSDGVANKEDKMKTFTQGTRGKGAYRLTIEHTEGREIGSLDLASIDLDQAPEALSAIEYLLRRVDEYELLRTEEIRNMNRDRRPPVFCKTCDEKTFPFRTYREDGAAVLVSIPCNCR